MIRVCVEVDAGTAPERVAVQAESINQAVSTMRGRYPGREVRVVFPIDSEEFFIEGSKKAAADVNGQPLHDSFTEPR
jgi:hypothetical protein